jgi:hypothetical protein
MYQPVPRHSVDQVAHQGYLSKQSRWLGQWRRRWTVIYNTGILCTYKPEDSSCSLNQFFKFFLSKHTRKCN